jgi:hypothetical protein
VQPVVVDCINGAAGADGDREVGRDAGVVAGYGVIIWLEDWVYLRPTALDEPGLAKLVFWRVVG